MQSATALLRLLSNRMIKNVPWLSHISYLFVQGEFLNIPQLHILFLAKYTQRTYANRMIVARTTLPFNLRSQPRIHIPKTRTSAATKSVEYKSLQVYQSLLHCNKKIFEQTVPTFKKNVINLILTGKLSLKY